MTVYEAVPGGWSPPGTTAVVGRRCLQFALDRLFVLTSAVALGVASFALRAPASHGRAFRDFTNIVVITLFVLAMAAVWFFDTWWPYRHGGQTLRAKPPYLIRSGTGPSRAKTGCAAP